MPITLVGSEGWQAVPARGSASTRTETAQLAGDPRWARGNGHQVSDHGRSKEIVDAYEAAP